MELVSVSAPIFDHNNKVVAAVTVPRFAESIDELGLMELGNQLMQLGKSISIRLGWTDNVSLRLNEVEC
jgi:DNA-binding IclR family transcriptional regulator